MKNLFSRKFIISGLFIPILILIIPFLLKYLINGTILISSEIVAIQFLFTFIWLITGRILAKRSGYIWFLVFYFFIYWFVFSWNLLLQYPPS